MWHRRLFQSGRARGLGLRIHAHLPRCRHGMRCLPLPAFERGRVGHRVIQFGRRWRRIDLREFQPAGRVGFDQLRFPRAAAISRLNSRQMSRAAEQQNRSHGCGDETRPEFVPLGIAQRRIDGRLGYARHREWRRRMGIEPTWNFVESHAGFEDQERHQVALRLRKRRPSKFLAAIDIGQCIYLSHCPANHVFSCPAN